MNKIKLNKYQNVLFFILAIIISALCFLPCLTVKNTSYALIESTGGYTGVMEDLQKDESFDLENYPVIENDYSLQVITIAENFEKELFVYVYQPCSPNDKFIATSINISTTTGDELKYKNYGLVLIDMSGTLYKYKVKNVIPSNDDVRNYLISSIFRKWYKSYDKDLEKYNDNTISEVAFKVGKKFTARYDVDGNLCYSCANLEVVTIIEKYNSYIRYTNGTVYNMEDRFFTAFSCDKPIDKLVEADVQFISFDYTNKIDLKGGATGQYVAPVKNQISTYSSSDLPYGYTYGPEEVKNKTLKCDNIVDIKVGFIFTQKCSWKEIQSVDEFKKDLTLSDTAIKNLADKDWVLNYYTAEYKEKYESIMITPVTKYEIGTRVKDVTILRLKFETDGVVYNLGAVDNKTTGSNIAGGTNKQNTSISSWVTIIIILLILVIFCILFPQVLPVLIKTIIWIITAPFKLIKTILNNKEK